MCFWYPDLCLALVQRDSPCPSTTASLCPPTRGLWPVPFLHSETSSDRASPSLLHSVRRWGVSCWNAEKLRRVCAAQQRREPSPTAIPSGFQHTAVICLRHHQEHGSTDLCTGTRHSTSVPVSGKRTTFGSGARSVPHWGVFSVGGRHIFPRWQGCSQGQAASLRVQEHQTAQSGHKPSAIKRKIFVYNFNCYHAFPCISCMTL